MDAYHIREITLLPGISRDGVRETFDEIVIRPGDTISIVGPTGSGKTALINDIEVFAQQDTATGRSVLVNGALPPDTLVRDPSQKPIALITQHTKCLADLSVREFLAMHLQARKCTDPARTEETITLANQFTGEAITGTMRMTALSGGQTRSLMVADAIVISDTPLILLDEIENAGIFKDRVIASLKEHQRAVIFVTHDPYVSLLSDRRIVMQHGAVVKVIESDGSEQAALDAVAGIDTLLYSLRERIRAGEQITGGVEFA
jgi:ABC-type lipoprotein export system ATPase subunit